MTVSADLVETGKRQPVTLGAAHHTATCDDRGTRVVHITGPGAHRWSLGPGQRLRFGRGPGVDLALEGNPWVSRQAGEISVFEDGVRITNTSARHDLWLEANGDAVKLPVLASGTGNIGCFLAAGTATINPDRTGDHGQAVQILIPEIASGRIPGALLDPGTKEFMVALLLCRPWLHDPLRIRPLPSAPQIAEEALAITGSHHQWERFAAAPGARQRLAAQVHEHLRCLRAKIRRYGLVPDDLELSTSAIAAVLLHHDLIGERHLTLVYDRSWLTAQEDKWWSTPT
ncbi:hypothetical protein GCM10027589_20270 [Actinocorallia lasiicapitis]